MKFTVDLIELNNQLIGRNHGNSLVGIDGLVYGRSLDEQDIPIGTVFSKIRSRITNIDDVIDEIHLKLVSVEFYQNKIDSIPGGHSARIELQGEGLLALAGALKNIQEHGYVDIEA